MVIEIISLVFSLGISTWLGLTAIKLVKPMIKAITDRNKAVTRACVAYADKWDKECRE